MAGNFEALAGPTYITSRSADVILSDVRPIKLKLEALRSMNVLLDEFLYKILSEANALSTERLKAGLHKVLPTTLGKDAVLEAELELKAYWERNTPHTPTNQDFDLQWSFELLRLKCEAYSTMNDTDEDVDVEKRLNEKMKHAGGTTPPHISLVAPAALYLTAILEHVCQHVLSNVSRVAARDSSRTLATVNDLFVALCEDPSVYPTFKTMKVYEQIEALSKAPRRTKSVSKSSTKSFDRSAYSRTASPSTDLTARDIGSPHRSRLSSDSVGHGAAAAAAVLSQLGNGRASHEKTRSKLFGGRSSTDHDRSETPGSIDEDGSFELMDEEAQREFDELMRSSTTMKVSLTPDRLKSMEVYKQERRRKAPVPPTQDSENDPVLIIDGGGGEVKRAVSARRVPARLVDAITEDDEPSPIKPAPSSPSQTAIVPRTRQKSLTAAAVASNPSDLPHTRSRSATVSNPNVLSKKRSAGQVKPAVPQMPPSVLVPHRDNLAAAGSPTPNGRPPRTRKMGRRRESMDLDDIMGGEDDDEVGMLSPPPTPAAAKRAPAKPHISRSARELIDFLDEGPPTELEPPNVNASMISLDSSRSKSGRLQRMMSKLSLSSSSEKLNGRGTTTLDSRRSPAPSAYLPSSVSSRTGRTMPTVVVATPPPPPSSFSPPPASYSPAPTTRSSPSIPHSAPAGYSSPPSVSPSPLFSPNGSISSALPPEFPSSPAGTTVQTHSETPVPESTSPTTRASRRTSIVRKAVPSLAVDPTTRERERRGSPSPIQPSPIQTGIVSPHSTTTPVAVEKPRRKSSSPLDEFPPVPTTYSPSHTHTHTRVTSGKSEMSIGAVIWAESSSTSSPFASPVGTAPPSPSASLRRPSKQSSVNGHVNGVEGKPLLPLSPGPEPEVEAEKPVSVPPVEDKEEEEKVAVAPQAAGSPSAFSFDDAQDLRRLLSSAGSADECRLIVDTFLVKSGYPVLTKTCGASLAEPAAVEEQESAKAERASADLEQQLVMHYLGGLDDDEEQQQQLRIDEPLSSASA